MVFLLLYFACAFLRALDSRDFFRAAAFFLITFFCVALSSAFWIFTKSVFASSSFPSCRAVWKALMALRNVPRTCRLRRALDAPFRISFLAESLIGIVEKSN